VEVAHELRLPSRSAVEASLEPSGIRLRPILMTSFAFIMGVLPLVFASGAGAEMPHVMDVAVVSGMLGVTFVVLVLTPVFYVVLPHLVDRRTGTQTLPSEPSGRRETTHA
jgi:multidrug efflux pump subunit AcrB